VNLQTLDAVTQLVTLLRPVIYADLLWDCVMQMKLALEIMLLAQLTLDNLKEQFVALV
jgi:hypothetical protein